jgi:hypothetical protein
MIAAEHIGGEDERIDGFRSRHTIRLTTTRQKSELIINEIEQTLGNIRREDVSLSDLMRPGHNWRQLQKWVDSHFNDSTIKDLSRMTNTEIQLLSKKRVYILRQKFHIPTRLTQIASYLVHRPEPRVGKGK